MRYNEGKLKKVERLLGEIQQLREDSLNKIRTIICELNGNDMVYKTRYDRDINMSENFSENDANEIITDMKNKNNGEERDNKNNSLREENVKRNKYTPENPYPPTDLR